MSQKSLRKKRQGTPRAMPVETIITRFKSAQQKKLHEQNQKKKLKSKAYMRSKRTNRQPASIKSDIIKCVVKEKPPKPIEELKESDKNEEYFPDKLRRPLLSKKVVLAPKPKYKLVGSLKSFNKRKLKKPIKENVYPQQRKTLSNEEGHNSSNLSIIDMISIQDSDSLDEEDLLEILTCPSPVWWEDPPDGYDEEPLPVKTQDNVINITKQQNINTQEQNFDEDLTSNALLIDVNIKEDKNFVNRRNKLENLLGNIKRIKTNIIDSNKEFKDSKLNKVFENRKLNKDSENSILNKDFENSKLNKDSEDNKLNKDFEISKLNKELEENSRNNSSSSIGRQKKSSESCDEESLDGSYDEILKTFENIDIPIKNTSNESINKSDDKQIKSPEKAKSTIKVLKFDTGLNTSASKLMPVTGLTIKNCDIRKLKPNKKNVQISEKIEQQNMNSNKKKKMILLKGLSEYRGIKIVNHMNKNKEIKKTDNRHCLNNEQELASITGLTIKNWDKHMMKQGNKNIGAKNSKSKSENKKDEVIDEASKLNIQSNNEKKILQSNTSDHVTVYKIIGEQENKKKKNIDLKVELNNDYNTQLNSYYNQCKNINLNKKEAEKKSKLVSSDCASEVNNQSIKSISISDSETVKYCLQCSSIFDTDTCKYCAKKFKSDSSDTLQTGINKDEHLKNVQCSEML